jgi:hypothetical protein
LALQCLLFSAERKPDFILWRPSASALTCFKYQLWIMKLKRKRQWQIMQQQTSPCHWRKLWKNSWYMDKNCARTEDAKLTSLESLWRISRIWEKSGLSAGSLCQHFWSSSANLGWVSFGIVGLTPWEKCILIILFCLEC